ncbi:Smr domain protein [Lysobacter dokdonensis DS-58]|uniref:Smr domain protein n=1 Tax=Lysobacter dokdonensis DS-58 TaxID=1300345 RepID=A0A0A2WHH9_9GAMM|nr:Smr/MutS family protein [Lysobacter dokdonensis]KGQ19646.1 Smr domain protein [Lysobacter dokdonensis DS-58]
MARKPPDPPPAEDPDDAALFRDAIGPVRELPAPPLPPSKPRPRPTPRMAARDEAEAVSEFRRAMTADALEAGDALSYRRDTVAPRTLQRLRRGEFAAQEELDLHWADAKTAEAMLREFLVHARQHGLGCVRIIHGKGLNSDSKTPMLKNLVDRMLRHRSEVVAFASAPANQGGTGAVLVLLAQKR